MQFLKKHYITLSTFLLPLTIMAIIFISLGLFPFGDESLLTTDLGMQYIDFFSEFRTTLLEDPSRLLYSFTKSIGGEMTGIWAYYLMSPFNLIFLLFPNEYLNVAVSLIILLKYGFAGFTMGYYLKKSFPVKFPMLLITSTSYALMGYMVNYHFNVMWTDAIIFLPLVALGIDRIVRGEGYRTYLFSLFITLWSNFYIGYMVCIFSVIYFAYRLFEQEKQSLKYYAKRAGTFALSSLGSSALGAVLLIPTFMQLVASKGAYVDDTFEWTSEYNIFDLLSKFVVGAFNFDQLPDGLPSVFITSLALLFCLAFFFNRKFTTKQKVLTGLVIGFFLLSMNISALNKVWHGFQFPVWFPYRFSFLFSFFILVTAYRSSLVFDRFKIWQSILITGLVIIGTIYIIKQDFDYIEPYQLIISVSIVCIYLIFMTFKFKQLIIPLALLILTTTEVTINAVISINSLGYINHSKYTNGVTILNDVVSNVQETADNDEFYRMNKTFQRSKNDSHQVDYNSATHFGSTYANDTITLFSKLGFPAFSGYSTYSNSTLITDAIFNMAYHIADNSVNRQDYFLVTEETEEVDFPSEKVSHILSQDVLTDYFTIVQARPDLHFYHLIKNYEDTIYAYENPYALPLVFKANDMISKVDVANYFNPLLFQNDILGALAGEISLELFNLVDTVRNTENVEFYIEGNNLTAEAIDDNQPAYIEYTFPTNQNDAYYLTLHEDNNVDNMLISIDERQINQTDTFHDTLVLNVAGRSHEDETTVRFEILNGEPFVLEDLNVYQLEVATFEEIIQELQSEGPVDNLTVEDNQITFNTTIENNDEMIFTSIPYDDSWQIKANGQEVEPQKLIDGLIGIDLPTGEYDITLNYETPLLIVGASISIVSWMGIIALWILEKRRRQ